VEYALFGRIAKGLSVRTVIDTRPEAMTFSEVEQRVFRLEGSNDTRIALAVPEPGTVVYSWWWARPGEQIKEQSRLIARL
jgi:hypothetical protein